jgi:hypothetical protein
VNEACLHFQQALDGALKLIGSKSKPPLSSSSSSSSSLSSSSSSFVLTSSVVFDLGLSSSSSSSSHRRHQQRDESLRLQSQAHSGLATLFKDHACPPQLHRALLHLRADYMVCYIDEKC